MSRGQYKILIADLREMEGGLEEIIRTKEALELLVEDGENEATQQVDKKPQLEQVKNLMTRLICSKKLLLKMILKVRKISAEWRFRSGNMCAKGFEVIPKTMTRCAQILLEEGDVKDLEKLFQGGQKLD